MLPLLAIRGRSAGGGYVLMKMFGKVDTICIFVILSDDIIMVWKDLLVA